MKKTKKNDKKLVLLENRPKSEHPEHAILKVEGSSIMLDNFILSGTTIDEQRAIITWNLSLEELASLAKCLQVIVDEKIKQALLDE